MNHPATRLPLAAILTTSAAAAALVSAALLGGACGSTPPAKAPEPSASATPTTEGAKNSPPKADEKQSSPTASSIHIDDAILKACGIEAPKAHFGFDSAHVLPEDAEPLEKVAKCFSSGPLKGRTLKLIGHADPRGESEYNFVLGNTRAEAVGGFISSKGLDKAQIASTSRGELDATGTDEDGWARDRRVDLMLGQ